jgi:hypothetical protein
MIITSKEVLIQSQMSSFSMTVVICSRAGEALPCAGGENFANFEGVWSKIKGWNHFNVRSID